MAEYASAIAGLVSIGIDIVQIIYRYSSSVHEAPKSVARLSEEAASLQNVLEQLDAFLWKHQHDLTQASALFFATSGCNAWLADFKKRLPPLSSTRGVHRLFSRLKWPLDEKSTQQAAECIHRFAETFHFALDVQGLYAIDLHRHQYY